MWRQLSVLMFSSLAEQGMFAQIKQVVGDVSSQVAVNPVWDMVPQMDKLSAAEKAELFKQAYEALAIRIPAYIMTFATIVAYVEYIIVSNMPWNRSKVKHMPALWTFLCRATHHGDISHVFRSLGHIHKRQHFQGPPYTPM